MFQMFLKLPGGFLFPLCFWKKLIKFLFNFCVFRVLRAFKKINKKDKFYLKVIQVFRVPYVLLDRGHQVFM